MGKGLARKFLGAGGQNPLLDIISNLITNPETGGLQAFVQNFKNEGFYGIISSWISTGKNLSAAEGNQTEGVQQNQRSDHG